MQIGSSKDLEKLVSMIKKIDCGMLTTVAEDGSLHSRPMSENGKVEHDGNLWFPEISLLKITARKAEFWDEPSSLIAQSIALVQLLAGQQPEMGDNKIFNLNKS